MNFIKFFSINILLLVIVSTTGIAQDISQVMFINELDRKETATYGDALRLLKFQIGIISDSDFDSYFFKGYHYDMELTKGKAARIVAWYLRLKQSLMYNIFKTERYAYRACVAEKFFSTDGSENDLMSGSELIELFSRVNERVNKIENDNEIESER